MQHDDYDDDTVGFRDSQGFLRDPPSAKTDATDPMRLRRSGRRERQLLVRLSYRPGLDSSEPVLFLSHAWRLC